MNCNNCYYLTEMQIMSLLYNTTHQLIYRLSKVINCLLTNIYRYHIKYWYV